LQRCAGKSVNTEAQASSLTADSDFVLVRCGSISLSMPMNQNIRDFWVGDAAVSFVFPPVRVWDLSLAQGPFSVAKPKGYDDSQLAGGDRGRDGPVLGVAGRGQRGLRRRRVPQRVAGVLHQPQRVHHRGGAVHGRRQLPRRRGRVPGQHRRERPAPAWEPSLESLFPFTGLTGRLLRTHRRP
jgi:hypothetical protein